MKFSPDNVNINELKNSNNEQIQENQDDYRDQNIEEFSPPTTKNNFFKLNFNSVNSGSVNRLKEVQ